MAANEEITERIYFLYLDDYDIHEAVEFMRHRNISAEVVKSVYKQLSADDDKMADRFHCYTIKIGNNGYSGKINYWTSRYLIGRESESLNPGFHEITIFDSFNNKSIKLSVKKSAETLSKIYPLKDGFGLLKEKDDENSFISLVFLDLNQRSFQKLQTVKYPSYWIKILVNKADPTTFLLNDKESWKICKIADKKIIFGEKIEIGFDLEWFYDKCVYSLYYYRDEYQKKIPQLCIYNVKEKTENYIDLKMPDGYVIISDGIGWIRDNLFVNLKSPYNTNVIACLNLETRQWNVLDFSSKFHIRSIYGFGEGNLIVNTDKKYDFYKISFGNPDSLENTAWLSLIKVMKKRDKTKDPYEAARKYLPPNSTINCPFENA